MNIARASVHPYAIPLRTPLAFPGGTVSLREGVLLCLEDDAGNVGWGDAAPLPYFSAESFAEARDALERCARALAGQPFPETMPELEERGLVACLGIPSVSFAFESAALHLRAAAAGIPVHRTLAQQPAETLYLNALLTGSVEEAALRAGECATQGYTAVKLKTGAVTVEEDIARVQAVRAALGPDIALRLDANRAWDFETATVFANAVRDCAIAYIEEPLCEPARLPEFFRKTGMPYAVDETLCGIATRTGPREFHDIIVGAEAAILKPTLSHFPGMANALLLGAIPAKTVVFSAAFESGVGLAAIAAYAAAYGTPGIAVGLDTHRWLENDLLERALDFAKPSVCLADIVQQGQTPHLEGAWFHS